MAESMKKIKVRVQRGKDSQSKEMKEYEIDIDSKSVVLDAVHEIQAQHDPNLAVRWNCKAGKCGSCAAEVDGKPKLMCMTKLAEYPKLDKGVAIEIRPMRSFPLVKDLVTDVSWNYGVNKKIRPFKPPTENKPLKMSQQEVNRIQEFRKCIECFLCQNTCHVIRTQQLFDEYAGPRFIMRAASLEMHPQDQDDRMKELNSSGIGVGYCNINRCCTEVCPESIGITDNAIIPMKERVVSRFYDPLTMILHKIFKR